MRKTALSAALFWTFALNLAISQNTSSPNSPIDTRLIQVFGKDHMDKVAKEDPFLLHRWTFYLDNAFFISDSPLSKDETDIESYPSVKIENLNQVNIFQLEQEQDLKRDYYTETIYRIAGTKKYLVYYAGRDFIEKFNLFWEAKKKENSSR